MRRKGHGRSLAGLSVFAVAPGVPAIGANDATGTVVLGKLSDSMGWTFERLQDGGAMKVIRSAEGDGLGFSAKGSEGMAASIGIRRFPLVPNRQSTIGR